MNSPTTETALRKRLSENPKRLANWEMLVDVLCSQKNFREVRNVCAIMLNLNSRSYEVALLSLRALFRSGFHREALNIAKSLLSSGVRIPPKESGLVYEMLYLLRGRPDELTQISDKLAQSGTIQEFNLRSLSNSDTCDIVFYLRNLYQYSIQRRIADIASSRGLNGLYAQHFETVLGAKPSILVVSEALYGRLEAFRLALPNSKIINTRHGLGDKNHAALGASQSDYICVSSQQIGDIFIKDYLTPESKVWVTGFPQMDGLFQRLGAHGNAPGALQRSVLFAPTFTPGLSAGLLVSEDVVEDIRGSDESIIVHIRPHPHFIRDNQLLVRRWKEKYSAQNNVFFHLSDDVNVFDLFDGVAVLVSDVSSVALAWMATGRPLVCFTNRTVAMQSKAYAPDGLEWRVQEAALVVEDRLSLREVVCRALQDPNSKREEREKWRYFLYGDYQDGRSSERIVERIELLLRGRHQ